MAAAIMEKKRQYVEDAAQDYAAIESSLEKEAREEFYNAREEEVPEEFAHLGIREYDQNFDEEVQDVTGPKSLSW